MANTTFTIVKNIGILSENYNSGWRKELNLIAWEGSDPQYDIRDWAPGHEQMSRGITLTKAEAEKAGRVLRESVPVPDTGISVLQDDLDNEAELSVELPVQKKQDISFLADIRKEGGAISKRAGGFRKEVNLVSWNGCRPVVDIREWGVDHKTSGDGVSLTEAEAIRLCRLLNNAAE